MMTVFSLNSHWRPAWKMSFFLTGFGYALIALLPLALGVALALGRADWRSPFHAVIVVVPLVGAIQAAFLFAPDDEPALEILLASPRPPQWLIYERAAAILGMQIAVGAGASLIVSLIPGAESLISQVTRWLPALLMLSGLSAAVSFICRRSSYGVLVAVLFYGATLFGGDALIIFAQETRLGLADPTLLSHAWVIHPFLQRGALGDVDFLVNRLVLSAGGLLLLLLMSRWVTNTERTLGKS